MSVSSYVNWQASVLLPLKRLFMFVTDEKNYVILDFYRK